jgi:hypothetical protein
MRKIVYEVVFPFILIRSFLYIFFLYIRPSNRNRIRVLQTTLLGCKRVCHVASASIRVPGARLLLTHSITVSLFLFFFICIYSLSFYLRFRYIYI